MTFEPPGREQPASGDELPGARRLLSVRPCFWVLPDPPPPTEVQPLEIIATTGVKPDRRCQLIVYEVGAGPHEVYLIAEQGPAVVRVLDPAGKRILEESVQPQLLDEDQEPQDLPAQAVPEIPVLRLGAGLPRIECVSDGQTTSTTELRVVPARPGFENMQPPR